MIGLYVPLQAVIGGITVLTNLNPYVVGLHFLASVALVALSAVLVVRVYATPGPRVLAVPRWYAVTDPRHDGGRRSSRSSSASSSPARARTPATAGRPATAWTRSSCSTCTRGRRTSCSPSRSCSSPARGALPRACGCRCGPASCSAVELLQIAVGLWQARTGLPIVLVNIHMVLAVLLVAAMTVVVMHLKAPAPAVPEPLDATRVS